MSAWDERYDMGTRMAIQAILRVPNTSVVVLLSTADLDSFSVSHPISDTHNRQLALHSWR